MSEFGIDGVEGPPSFLIDAQLHELWWLRKLMYASSILSGLCSIGSTLLCPLAILDVVQLPSRFRNMRYEVCYCVAMSSIVTRIYTLREKSPMTPSIGPPPQPSAMQISLKYKQSQPKRLHAVLLQVLAELDDRVVGVGGLDAVGVVGDDEGLCGLEDNDAFLALCCVSVSEC
jgi:hypothetical protein